MTEIKSTLDIVLEKTKNMDISPDEMAEIKRKEWAAKAKRWMDKYLEGELTFEELKEELEKAPGVHKDYHKDYLLDELISSLDLSDRVDRIKEGLESLSGKNLRAWFRKIVTLRFTLRN